jgi:hypothetical protein
VTLGGWAVVRVAPLLRVGDVDIADPFVDGFLDDLSHGLGVGDLVKQGNTLFRIADPKTTPIVSSAEVQQGKLESSNVGASESVVRLVSVMRQFDMLQKAIHIGSAMNRKAIDEVAKIGN